MPAKLMRKKNASSLLKFLRVTNTPFRLTCSNYTSLFESKFLKEKYVMTIQSNKTFAAYSKIKSNVKDKPVPEIDREQLRYFQHNFKQDYFAPVVYNIDLKSAYATVLYNDKFITKETFRYMSGLEKRERLACVGMLAAKKHMFDFVNGEATETGYTESPFTNIFYHAVQKTDEIMSYLKSLCHTAYLFTWVDGIYYSDESYTESMSAFLKNINFKYSFEMLTDFTVKVIRGKVTVSYFKDDVFKIINMPTDSTQFKLMASRAIYSLNENKRHGLQNLQTKSKIS